jgi:hypothetical protein
MINITINKQDYNLCNDFKDITIAKAIDVCNIPIPDNLKQYYKLIAEALNEPNAEKQQDIIKQIFP